MPHNIRKPVSILLDDDFSSDDDLEKEFFGVITNSSPSYPKNIQVSERLPQKECEVKFNPLVLKPIFFLSSIIKKAFVSDGNNNEPSKCKENKDDLEYTSHQKI